MIRFGLFAGLLTVAWTFIALGLWLLPRAESTWVGVVSIAALTWLLLPYEWRLMREKRWRDRRCK